MIAPHRPASRWLALTACAVAVLGVAAIWGGVAAILRGPCAWMACIAAADACLLLRLADWPAGRSRAAMGIGVTGATIALASMFVATARIGQAMGLRPAEALGRMSTELAWLYTQANTGPTELAWYALALVIAWRGAR